LNYYYLDRDKILEQGPNGGDIIEKEKKEPAIEMQDKP